MSSEILTCSQMIKIKTINPFKVEHDLSVNVTTFCINLFYCYIVKQTNAISEVVQGHIKSINSKSCFVLLANVHV